MATSNSHPNIYTLWSTPHSLYSGKVRSYLIKKGIAFRERCSSNPQFKQRVLPAVGLVVFPILETPDGKIIQDSTDIVEHIEAQSLLPSMTPPTPIQNVVALLLDGFGLEGLLQVAMHYRWSYRKEQEHFLRAEFGRGMYAGPDREKRLATGEKIMGYFNSFLPVLGVTPETIPAIESAYVELLDVLDIHFQHYPYLLGRHPSIADFGFMAPMFAHLGRDPYPASLMKNLAPNVYRWVERMNLANISDGEYPEGEDTWLANDAIPETLEPVLALLFRDWGSQLRADAKHFNAWLESSPSFPAGQLVNVNEERKVHPTLGLVEYEWRGCKVRRASAVHGLWLFDKALAAANELSGDARSRFAELVHRNSGEEIMAIRLNRKMERQKNVLVLR